MGSPEQQAVDPTPPDPPPEVEVDEHQYHRDYYVEYVDGLPLPVLANGGYTYRLRPIGDGRANRLYLSATTHMGDQFPYGDVDEGGTIGLSWDATDLSFTVTVCPQDLQGSPVPVSVRSSHERRDTVLIAADQRKDLVDVLREDGSAYILVPPGAEREPGRPPDVPSPPCKP